MIAWIRDGHDTDTKYQYCRYLQVRYFYLVSLVFDTEPALFMVSMYMYQSEEKEKYNIFWSMFDGIGSR